MRTLLTRRGVRTGLAILCAGLLCAQGSWAAYELYLDVEGIDGESTVDGHEHEINVLETNLGIEGFENGVPLVMPAHQPLRVKKYLDKATPHLLTALAQTSPLEEIFLITEKVLSGERILYCQVRITDALVVGFDSVIQREDYRPTEWFTFDYPYAEWYVRRVLPNGTVEEFIGTYYNMVLGESGTIGTSPGIGQVPDQSVSTGDTLNVDLEISNFTLPPQDLTVTATSADSSRSGVPSLSWTGSNWRLSLVIPATGNGSVAITVQASDGDYTRSMAFNVLIDSAGTPFDGFMHAYFTEAELLDPVLSSPIGDPDHDRLSTVLEFLVGTNPREFTPQPEAFQYWPEDLPGEGRGIRLNFLRRVDEPGIQLVLECSKDAQLWTGIGPGSFDPEVEEMIDQGPNPAFQEVSLLLIPPPEFNEWRYLLRFAAQY